MPNGTRRCASAWSGSRSTGPRRARKRRKPLCAASRSAPAPGFGTRENSPALEGTRLTMPTTVSLYLIERLVQLRLEHLFCVAGNFNVEFLDVAGRDGRLKCVTTTNELEAGY